MRNAEGLMPGAKALPGAAAVILLLALLTPGCTFQTAAPAGPVPTGFEPDPCEERLHGLCEQLFLYYAAHRELPETLGELSQKKAPALTKPGQVPASGQAAPTEGTPAAKAPDPVPGPGPLVCPKSGQPYLYDRQGVRILGWEGRMIVYDAQPCHAGTRWAILIGPVRTGKPLEIRVERPREDAIVWPKPAPTD